MTLPSFSALAAISRCGAFGSPHSQYNNSAVVNAVTAAAQCCPPGFEAGGCTGPTDCSQLRCKPPLICCDCTLVHCTTKQHCQYECSQ